MNVKKLFCFNEKNMRGRGTTKLLLLMAMMILIGLPLVSCKKEKKVEKREKRERTK